MPPQDALHRDLVEKTVHAAPRAFCGAEVRLNVWQSMKPEHCHEEGGHGGAELDIEGGFSEIGSILKADSGKLDISVVKPGKLRVVYRGWDDAERGRALARQLVAPQEAL